MALHQWLELFPPKGTAGGPCSRALESALDVEDAGALSTNRTAATELKGWSFGVSLSHRLSAGLMD